MEEVNGADALADAKVDAGAGSEERSSEAADVGHVRCSDVPTRPVSTSFRACPAASAGQALGTLFRDRTAGTVPMISTAGLVEMYFTVEASMATPHKVSTAMK